MHSEEGEAAALKHIYMQSMAPTLEELSSASVQTVREKGVEWHERGAVTLGVAPSITPARAQPPASPLLAPREPGRGETLLALTSLETGSVPPHVPHGPDPSAHAVNQTTENCIHGQRSCRQPITPNIHSTARGQG
jgi:hypothetical protein